MSPNTKKNAGQDAAPGNHKIFMLFLAVQQRQVLTLQRSQGNEATDTPRFRAIANASRRRQVPNVFLQGASKS